MSVLWHRAAIAAADATPTKDATAYELIEQGRQALAADKFADASTLLQRAMAHPDFRSADPKLQYWAFVLASHAAEGTQDNLTAYEYLVIATSAPAAIADDWLRRARTGLILEKWQDAALSLITVARKWPKTLSGDAFNYRMISMATHALGRDPGMRAQRTELLDVLFTAGYQAEYEFEPSHLWVILATDAVERRDYSRAREISRRITAHATWISMRIDKRFDVLVKLEPRLFDIRAAALREAKQLKQAVHVNPNRLGPLVWYGEVLLALGRFDELIALAERAITRVEGAPQDSPPYEDQDRQLNWVYNLKSTALTALGRWEEAAEVLVEWRRSGRNHEDTVSQAINLGVLYNEMGRPDDALQAVHGIDWSGDISPYGRVQLQYVRFQAYLQKGNEAETRDILTWMRDHQDDAIATVQATLLEVGDVEGAAELFKKRLRDADERADALSEVQQYAQASRTARREQLNALGEVLLARADVVAAIAEVGRREKLPVYSARY
jgi:tetratricopeptide (TPR) repeat protein